MAESHPAVLTYEERGHARTHHGQTQLPKKVSFESSSTERDHLLQGEQFRPPNEKGGLWYNSPQVVWHGSLKKAFSTQGYTLS